MYINQSTQKMTSEFLISHNLKLLLQIPIFSDAILMTNKMHYVISLHGSQYQGYMTGHILSRVYKVNPVRVY